VYLRERTGRVDRAVSFTSTDGASVTREYRLNGALAPFDDAARQWLASTLPSVLADMGVNVGPRVARWRAEGGVDGALRHIGDLRSSGAKRAHLEALLEDKQLKGAEVDRVVRQAGREVPSSGDLRSVLSKAAPQGSARAVSPSALEEAISAVASSGDKRAVLEAYGQTNDRDMLLMVMRLAPTVASSGDRSNLLSDLSRRYFERDDAALRTAFFNTAATIPSSGDLASLLDDAIPFAVKSNDVALAVIETAAHCASSGDRSRVLITLADRGGVRTQAARDAYLRVAKDLPSSTDMSAALQALVKH
jgi:hypothetical protein